MIGKQQQASSNNPYMQTGVFPNKGRLLFVYQESVFLLKFQPLLTWSITAENYR